jgi:hypothetical protein
MNSQPDSGEGGNLHHFIYFYERHIKYFNDSFFTHFQLIIDLFILKAFLQVIFFCPKIWMNSRTPVKVLKYILLF